MERFELKRKDSFSVTLYEANLAVESLQVRELQKHHNESSQRVEAQVVEEGVGVILNQSSGQKDQVGEAVAHNQSQQRENDVGVIHVLGGASQELGVSQQSQVSSENYEDLSSVGKGLLVNSLVEVGLGAISSDSSTPPSGN